MPANKGLTPNWHPVGDFAGSHHDIKPAQAERLKPTTPKDFVDYILTLGLPDVECYFGDDKRAIAEDITENFYKEGGYADDMVDAFYGIEQPDSEAAAPVTMLVIVKTLSDGSTEASSMVAPYQRGAWP